jgi:hypothetical protein
LLRNDADISGAGADGEFVPVASRPGGSQLKEAWNRLTLPPKQRAINAQTWGYGTNPYQGQRPISRVCALLGERVAVIEPGFLFVAASRACFTSPEVVAANDLNRPKHFISDH